MNVKKLVLKPTYFIHETAIVEDNVVIGERSKVWHQCHVMKGAIIGDDVSLGKGVFIDRDVEVQSGSRIQNGVSVYKGVKIQKSVFVGPNVTFTNDRFPRAGIKNWHLSETLLKDGCSIGAGSVITPDIEVGAFALIGAGSVLTETIPDFHLAYGLPARIVSKICACGCTRLEMSTRPKDYIQKCCQENLKEEVLELAKSHIKSIILNEQESKF